MEGKETRTYQNQALQLTLGRGNAILLHLYGLRGRHGVVLVLKVEFMFRFFPVKMFSPIV
jgi:hypothetical protein